MKVKELREMAKVAGIKGYSKMNKAELEKALNVNDDAKYTRETIPGDGMMICSITYGVCLAAGMRCISENDALYMIDVLKNSENWNAVMADHKAKKIIKKIPPVFQIRHEGIKGIVVIYPLEFVPELKDKDIIVPESARKFASSDWNEVPLEVCNYLKRKSPWVALNPQFIQALEFENPDAMNVIADYWFDYMNQSLNDISKAQEFHGILSNINGENGEINSNLVQVLRNCSFLLDDFQVRNWRRDQYTKFIEEMKVGKIFVPGQYTYMVCDPAGILNRIYGLNLPELKSGEYWFNNKTCQAGLFRSPLIAPFEAQKVQLVENEFYSTFYRDLCVFNCYDGAWENMGGGDFDGDTCAVIPNDTPLGSIIADSIVDPGYVVWEKGLSAKKDIFSWDQYAKFNAQVAKVDRTGIITNFATRCIDIKRHLESAIYFGKEYGCEGVVFHHPASLPENGNKFKPGFATIDGKKVVVLRGFCECVRKNIGDDEEGNPQYVIEYVNEENNIEGFYTFDEVQEIANGFLYKTEYLRLLQGREIDGAKTGVSAEGLSGEDYVDSVKVKFTPHHLITRQGLLKRPSAGFALANEYVSLSPLGRLHDYVTKRQEEFNDSFDNGADKIPLLLSLLTEEEYNQVNSTITMVNGKQVSFIDFLKDVKVEYGKKFYSLRTLNLTEEERLDAFSGIKESMISDLEELAEKLNYSIEAVAVGCYIATYARDGKFNTGLSFGWILFNDILSVFSRANKGYRLTRLPQSAEEVKIINKIVFVDGIRYGEIEDAYDTDYLPIQTINGKNYGLVHTMPSKKAPKAMEQKPLSSTTYKIEMIYGFRNYGMTRDDWKNAVKANGFVFDIAYGEDKRIETRVNGVTFGSIKTNAVNTDFSLFELPGHSVRVTAVEGFTDNTIKGITVQVIS